MLQAQDLPEATQLSYAAGWNQTTQDWQMLLDLAPATCFGIEMDGSVVATTILLPLGPALAWLGMVLTRRDYQHRGLARRLVTHSLEAARRLGLGTVGLDATDQGQPIYKAVGFVAGPAIERWAADEIRTNAIQPAHADAPPSNWVADAAELDRAAFGTDRTALLTALMRHGWSAAAADQGYASARPGRRANYVGPCVARTPELARDLISRCFALRSGPWMWDLFPGHAATAALAAGFGFQPVRHLVRMYHGQPPAGDSSLIYATAGFELG